MCSRGSDRFENEFWELVKFNSLLWLLAFAYWDFCNYLLVSLF